jgi:hypothetical protein
MATLHMICGLPCSGKTTLARELERDLNAVRLTPDEWAMRMMGERLPAKGLPLSELQKIRDPIESLLWDLAVRLLGLGVDVIIDFGFWTREDRERFRVGAAAIGARSELHYLDVPEEELLRRLEARNADLPAGTFWIDPAWMREWFGWFEAPVAEELVAREANAL